MRDDKENIIVDLTFKFSIKVISYCEELESKKKFVLARQLLRSGTSIGANAREAQNAESKADFVHKFKIAAKEADETEYWLLLCRDSKSYPNPQELLESLTGIQRVISKIISSSKKK
ncbi:MAG: four helix bundle protein [Bacteroidetes bacterium]|nr:four helix bundle protein [Bacteroidota bacterium]